MVSIYKFGDEEHIPVERYFAEGVKLLWGKCMDKYSYLCLSLLAADFKPAFPLVRRSVKAFFERRNPKTGLIPSPGVYGEMGLQSVSTGGIITGILEWFCGDEEIVMECKRFADAIWRYFRSEEGGLYYNVNVETGRPEGVKGTLPNPNLDNPGWTYTSYYGFLSRSYAKLYVCTEEDIYRERCEYLVNFVWDRRFRETDIPPNTLSINGGFPGIEGLTFKYPQTDSVMVDTDCLYWVNSVYDIYNILGDPFYRDIALRATDGWLRCGWRDEWDHFVTCVYGDGSPGSGPFFERIYGDSKYNVLRLMVNAYRVTGDQRYMNYYDRFWECLKRNSIGGLIPYILERGRIPSPLEGPGTGPSHPGNINGIDNTPSHFIGLLIDAWEATENRKYLKDAYNLTESIKKNSKKILKTEPQKIRGLGHNLTRLSTTSKKLVKTSINMKEKGWQLTINKNDKNLINTPIKTKKAVIYLEKGWYTFKIEKKEKTREFKIYLNRDMNLHPRI